MFNVSGGELFVIFVVALIVLGPERLPVAARKAGQVIGQLRDLSDGFRREVARTVDDPGEPIIKPRSTDQAAPRPQLAALAGGGGEAGPAEPADGEGAVPASAATQNHGGAGPTSGPAGSPAGARRGAPGPEEGETWAPGAPDGPTGPPSRTTSRGRVTTAGDGHADVDPDGRPVRRARSRPPARPPGDEAARVRPTDPDVTEVAAAPPVTDVAAGSRSGPGGRQRRTGPPARRARPSVSPPKDG